MLISLLINLPNFEESRLSQFILEGSGADITFNSFPINSFLLFSTQESLQSVKQNLSKDVAKK